MAKFQKNPYQRFTFTRTCERNGPHGDVILPESAKGGQFGFGLLMQIDDGKRYVVHADELSTAFLELESATRANHLCLRGSIKNDVACLFPVLQRGEL